MKYKEIKEMLADVVVAIMTKDDVKEKSKLDEWLSDLATQSPKDAINAIIKMASIVVPSKQEIEIQGEPIRIIIPENPTKTQEQVIKKIEKKLSLKEREHIEEQVNQAVETLFKRGVKNDNREI